MIRYKLTPYTERKLDCYQNMIVSLLDNYGCDLRLLGAKLPWRYCRRNVTGSVANCYIANDATIESIYGYKIVRSVFHPDRIIETIVEALKSSPIIVNVDQYYVPHHYKHIYRKQHGQHSLLINGYNENEKLFYCIDSFPQYTGKITWDDIKFGIKNFPEEYVKMQFSTVEKIEKDIKHDHEIFSEFMYSSEAYVNGQDKEVFSNQAILYLLENIIPMNDVDFFSELRKLCEGTWTWELDRIADWTISYLNTEYVIKRCGEKTIKLINDLILQCNKVTVMAYRLIYKSTVSKSRNVFRQGYDKLRQVIILQNQILEVLKNI